MSDEFDPVNLELLVKKYKENIFAKALIFDGKVIDVYGFRGNFLVCIEYA